MATTEEIVAKYRLDLDELKGQVKTLQTEFGKVDGAAKKSADASDKAFAKLGDSLKNLGKTVVAAFAVERIIAFGKASVQAYAEAEKGAQKLRSAVLAGGGLQSDFKQLTEQAEELAAITIFDDDQIKNAQTMALQFGLNANAVQKLIPKVADFAAATGQDLSSALQAVIAGINGQERALKPYGIELDNTVSRNERLGTIIEKITEKFNGQAEALTNTLGGSLGEAQQAFDELQESIGAALAPAITEASKALTQFFNTLAEPPQDPLVDEIANLDIYREKLFDANLGQDERKKLINELKTAYPGYLDFLNADKATNAELSQALNLVTNELVDQLVIRQQTAKVEEKQAKLNEARAKVAAKQGETANLLVQARQQGIIVEDKYVTVQERAARAIELLKNKSKEANIAQRIELNVLVTELEKTALGIGSFSSGYVQSLQEEKQAIAELNTQQKTRTDVLKELGLSAQNYTKIEQDALEKLIATGDKLAVQENDRRKKLAAATQTTGLEAQTEAQKAAAAAAAKAARERQAKAVEEAKKQAEAEAKVREDLRKQGLADDQENLKLYNQERLRQLTEQFAAEDQLAQKNAIAAQARNLADLQKGLINFEEYEKRKAKIAESVPDPTKVRERAKLQLQLETLETQRQNLLDYGEDVKQIDQDILDKKAEISAANVAIEQDASAKRIATAEQEAKLREELLKKEQEQRKANIDKTIELSQELFDNLVALQAQEAEERIRELENRRNEETTAADNRQKDLDAQLEKRLISQSEYQKASDEVAAQRLATEKTISDEIKKLKKKEDAAAKAQALFRIGIDTARAIQAQLAVTPLPAGAFFLAAIAASGLLQAGTVLAAKPPAYAEGTDWVPLGRNKRGRDTIPALLDEGERVVSRKKNLDNWDLYQAVDHGRLEEYIFKRYTLPALQAERAKGGPVVQALGQLLGTPTTSATGPDAAELRRLFRRGLPITNLDELAALLAARQSSPFRA